MRTILENMPRMRMCEGVWERLEGCQGRIEWHHVWIYAGTQINEIWAILGACERHHGMVKTHRIVKETFERRSLEIATEEELAMYPRKNWVQIKKYLNIQQN